MNRFIQQSISILLLLGCVPFIMKAATLLPGKPTKGLGTADAPYEVSIPEHLVWMAEEVNRGNRLTDVYFVQTADVDLSQSRELHGGEGWMPIGGYFMIGGVRTKTGFEGHYDGQGHTIAHLYINRPESEYQALFGYLSRGSVRNLVIEDARVVGLENVAAAFAYTFEALVVNCHVKASDVNCKAFYGGGLIGFQAWGTTEHSSAEATLYGRDYIGGLVGWCETGKIINSHSKGKLHGIIYNGVQPRHCGGLIGYCNKSTIERVSCSSVLIEGGEWTGGLIGSAEQSEIRESISRCGTISGLSYVGGIAGRTNESQIRNCYTTSSVVGEQYVGGVTGFCTYSTSQIDCVYSTSCVSEASPSSIFVGAVLGGYGTGVVKNVIYNGLVNPSLPAIAGPNQGDCDVKSRSSEEMKQRASYPNWDFNTIWMLSPSYNEGFPVLKWETEPQWNSLTNITDRQSDLRVWSVGDAIYINTSSGEELLFVYGIDGVSTPFSPISEGVYTLLSKTNSSILILVSQRNGELYVTKRMLP